MTALVCLIGMLILNALYDNVPPSQLQMLAPVIIGFYSVLKPRTAESGTRPEKAQP